jgi:hypothetical protein
MGRTRIRNPFLPASVASANSVVRLRSSYALPLLAFSLSLAMVIFLGWTSGFFGMVNVSTPSFRSAWAWSGSQPSGRVKLL